MRPMRVDPEGVTGPTRGRAFGPRWRRVSVGYYLPVDVDRSVPEQRILEESVRLADGGAVTAWGSLRMHGGNFFDGLHTDGVTERPVPLAVGPLHQLQPQDPIFISRERLLHSEIEVIAGIPCTVVLRALFDEMRFASDVREAVVAMDMAAAAELASVRQMRDYVGERRGWKGVGQVRAALDLASEDSRSPNESRMRLVWVCDAGHPSPLCNRPVFDLEGKLIGYPDLLDAEAGVVGEYDGADHRAALRQSKDVRREDNFRALGLEYFKVTGPDMHVRTRMVERMTSTRARALWLPAGRRRWTVVPPPWFQVQPCLDDRLEIRRVVQEMREEQFASAPQMRPGAFGGRSLG